MFDLIQEIYSTIRRNKLRTALTGFAVAWGIFMLIVLLGAGNGLLNATSEQSGSLVLNSMQVWPGRTSKPYKGLKSGRAIELTQQELQATCQDDRVEKAAAVLSQSGVLLSHGSDHVRTGLEGVWPIHPSLGAVDMKHGRFINQIDIDQKRKVIVLHEKTIEMLFGERMEKARAVGQQVKVGALNFLIVGVFSDQNNFSPSTFVPFTTLQLIYQKKDDFTSLLMLTRNVNDEASAEAFEQDYRRTIGSLQQFDPLDRSALFVWNHMRQYAQNQTAQSALHLTIWIIGIFTLLSGIVGVSNILLITVKERTREFGIRKALGAKPRQILWLIVAESVAITTFFGYLGMVAGIAATEWMNRVAGEQVLDIGVAQATVFRNPTVDLHIAIQATLTLVIAGTLAGLFPARKATKIRPVEALNAN